MNASRELPPRPPARAAMRAAILLAAVAVLSAAGTPDAHAFCGFYVASGEAKLFNRASQVALVRDGDRTVMTLANDFKGEPKAFALVVPVPTVLRKDQIHVGDPALVDRIDGFTAPRLVEYFDPSPCATDEADRRLKSSAGQMAVQEMVVGARSDRARGVTIEARYTVGEYDILILSAKESAGLERWLIANGYRIPRGASRVLGGYVRQGLKFFVAKVNLEQHAKLGFLKLRPLQMAFESPRFGLPIRLGMVNADGPQELFVYAITRTGRVEPVNYRSVKLPTDAEIPEYVQKEFPSFYRAMFAEQVRKHDMSVVFTEYVWNMAWCDPCAAPPLSADELRGLGVWWAGGSGQPSRGGGAPVFVTRLHARYDAAHFPEDLVLQATSDQTQFQGRYVIRHPWQGDDCPGAQAYREQLRERRRLQAEALASLTGWDRGAIRTAMGADADWSLPEEKLTWWQRLWGK